MTTRNSITWKGCVSMIFKKAGDNETKYQMQYADWTANEWTVPVLLTKLRANRMLNDSSISRVIIISEEVEYEAIVEA